MKISLYFFLAIFSCIVVQNIFAQVEQEISSNDLGACVKYFTNINGVSSDELPNTELQNEQFKDSYLKHFVKNAIPLMICNIGYEETGKYTHLLPQEIQDKYVKLATNQIESGLE
ncbi:MAG: hypothetical protein R3321_13730 [Nitrososphaeraceae archaeon]|nr:hypothetical protein [Nitrososphaeraceae archaeon]